MQCIPLGSAHLASPAPAFTTGCSGSVQIAVPSSGPITSYLSAGSCSPSCSPIRIHMHISIHIVVVRRSRSTPSRCSGSPSLSSRSSNSISRESTLPAPAFSSLLLHARHLIRTNPFSSPRFIPIVALALVFNVTNAIGFTYACVPQNPRSACN